jgi:hypothetical protein
MRICKREVERMHRKIIGIIICMLFIGVSVSSAISVDVESTIINNQSEECRECKGISNIGIVNLDRQLNKLKVYSMWLLILSKHNPNVLENYEEISNRTSTLNTQDLNEVICNKLINILEYVLDRFSYCCRQIENFTKENRRIMVIIYTIIGNVYNALIHVINNIAFKLGCENPYFP